MPFYPTKFCHDREEGDFYEPDPVVPKEHIRLKANVDGTACSTYLSSKDSKCAGVSCKIDSECSSGYCRDGELCAYIDVRSPEEMDSVAESITEDVSVELDDVQESLQLVVIAISILAVILLAALVICCCLYCRLMKTMKEQQLASYRDYEAD